MSTFQVTDSHAHWWPSREFVHQRSFWSPFIAHLRDSLFREMGFDISPETLERQFFDPEGRQLLVSMAAAGIDRTVLLPLDWGLQYGEAAIDIITQNRAYAELADRYPGRFVPFFGIDPNRADGDRHFRTAVCQWGMKGLKL
jgi:predicted TIM-barrel fold metal-dependent hydrolase